MLLDKFKKNQQSNSKEVTEQIEQYEPPTTMQALPITADLRRRQFADETFAELKKKNPDIKKRKTYVWL